MNFDMKNKKIKYGGYYDWPKYHSIRFEMAIPYKTKVYINRR